MNVNKNNNNKTQHTSNVYKINQQTIFKKKFKKVKKLFKNLEVTEQKFVLFS